MNKYNENDEIVYDNLSKLMREKADPKYSKLNEKNSKCCY